MLEFIRKNKVTCAIIGTVIIVFFAYYVGNVYIMNAKNDEKREETFEDLMNKVTED